LILSLLPSELIINKRAILIVYKIISDNKVMIILTNITDNKKLQNKIKREQGIQKMIVTIVSDSSHFYEIKEGFEEFCKDSILYIKITDDGRGINMEKLKSRIIGKNLSTIERLNFMSKDEILNFIFNSNLSTSDRVTHISGKGIGLSSLKNNWKIKWYR